VTGLLDGFQDKKRKQNMYSIAKEIGLPATFVELRHQATHEELPTLPKFRSAAQRAMTWIWDYYWRDLEDHEVTGLPEETPKRPGIAGASGSRNPQALKDLPKQRNAATEATKRDDMAEVKPVRSLAEMRAELAKARAMIAEGYAKDVEEKYEKEDEEDTEKKDEAAR
jgi:ribosomal biogenesis protein LAS1